MRYWRQSLTGQRSTEHSAKSMVMGSIQCIGRVIFLSSVLLLAGCAASGTGPVFSPVPPSADRSTVYFYRVSSLYGSGVYIYVFADDDLVASVGNGGYGHATTAKKKMTVYTGWASAHPVLGLFDDAVANRKLAMSLDLQPGTSRYLRVDLSRVEALVEVPEETALSEMRGLHRFEIPK